MADEYFPREEGINPIRFPKRLPSTQKLYLQGSFFIFKTFHRAPEGTRFLVAERGCPRLSVIHLPDGVSAFWLEQGTLWYIEETDEGYRLCARPWIPPKESQSHPGV